MQQTLPLQIGVTGGIGSGKSLVCHIFSCLGIPVYEADARAKWLTNNDEGLKARIVSLLGEQAYDGKGQYNRSYVASKVFKDETLLKSLNAIIHPAVGEDTRNWVESHKNKPYIIKEAAIMNRAGDRNDLDFVVLVHAPVALRITRILQRDKRSEEEVRAIISKQASDEQRAAIANFTVQNGDSDPVIPQVLALHKRFLQEVGRRRN